MEYFVSLFGFHKKKIMFFTSFRTISSNVVIKLSTGKTSVLKTIKMCAQRNFSSEFVGSITVSPDTSIYINDLNKVSPGVFKTPPKPLKLTVQYADTALGRDPKKFDKTIVAIHGTPGYYTHFDTLVEHYKDSNVRIVAPNLPDFSHTRENGYYWSTTPERASFVKQFLRDLNITEIDCLISHSYGAQCISAIWFKVSFFLNSRHFDLKFNPHFLFL